MVDLLELGDVSVRVSGAGGASPTVQTASSRDFDDKFERGIFSFPAPLPAGATARLSIPFKGELTGDLLGYYFSKGGADGERRRFCATAAASPPRSSAPAYAGSASRAGVEGAEGSGVMSARMTALRWAVSPARVKVS